MDSHQRHIPSALTCLLNCIIEKANQTCYTNPHLFLHSGLFFSLTVRQTRKCESGKFKGLTGEILIVQDKKGFKHTSPSFCYCPQQ